jgi:hypothetical protein
MIDKKYIVQYNRARNENPYEPMECHNYKETNWFIVLLWQLHKLKKMSKKDPKIKSINITIRQDLIFKDYCFVTIRISQKIHAL